MTTTNPTAALPRVTAAMLHYYGPRCPDVEPGCGCCEAWAEFDRRLTPSEPVATVRDNGSNLSHVRGDLKLATPPAPANSDAGLVEAVKAAMLPIHNRHGRRVCQGVSDPEYHADLSRAALSAIPIHSVNAELVERLRSMTEWVQAALSCEAWGWDSDQREVAVEDVANANAALSRAKGEGA